MASPQFEVLMASLFAAVAMILEDSPSWVPCVLAVTWLLTAILGEVADRKRN